ncbi:MAG: hypothetical protein AAF702_28425 [Chloroflexota bacterium]
MARKRTQEYTLGELAGGIDKKLRKLLRVEQLDSADNVMNDEMLAQLLDDCIQDTWIRNQVGAHFNLKAAGISDVMVKHFGDRVLALADVMLCSVCHQLPRRNKSGSYWQCGGGCGKVRLYPLESP